MKIDILDIQGNTLGKADLSSGVFDVKANPNLVSQYIRTYLSNQRQGTSSTKTRAEVSGGGRKPWRQKHTGRSRQGSIRSPIWVHGGVSHGPKPKDWSLKNVKSIKQLVLKSVLSDKLKNKRLIIVDNFFVEEPKTKNVVKALISLGVEGKILLVWSERNDNFLKSAVNIPGLDLSDVKNINAYQVLNSDYVVLDKGALNYLEGSKK